MWKPPPWEESFVSFVGNAAVASSLMLARFTTAPEHRWLSSTQKMSTKPRGEQVTDLAEGRWAGRSLPCPSLGSSNLLILEKAQN